MAHKLDIQIQDAYLSTKYISVTDLSIYDKLLPVDNAVLKVDIPGQSNFKILRLPINGSFTYTSKSLKISKSLIALPDGMYRFTYSICPNDRVFVKYNHFRYVDLQARVIKYISDNFSNIENKASEFSLLLLELKSLSSKTMSDFDIQIAYDIYNKITNKIK